MRRLLASLHYLGILISAGLAWLSCSVSPQSERAVESAGLMSRSLAISEGAHALEEGLASVLLGRLTGEQEISLLGERRIREQAARIREVPNLRAELRSELDLLVAGAQQLSSSAATRKQAIDIAVRGEKLTQALGAEARERASLVQDRAGEALAALDRLRKVALALSLSLCLFLTMYSVFVGRMRRSELLLRRSERLQSPLFSSLAEGVLLCAPDGRILSCNQSAAVILGVHSRSLIARNLDCFYLRLFREGGAPFDEGKRPLHDILAAGKTVSQLVIGFSSPSDGLRWISLNAQPILEVSENGPFSMLLSFTDVTSRVDMLADLERHRAQQVAAAKLAALGEMVTEVAHDNNNPMSVIRSSAEILEMRMKNQEQLDEGFLKKFLDRISGMVARVTRITGSILTYSRDGSHDPMEEVSVRKLIEDSIALCALRLRRMEVLLDCGDIPESIRIQAKLVPLSQAFVNLVSNACDALDGQPDARIRVDVKEHAGRLWIQVSDNGPGIAPEIQAKIFMPFFTTKPVGKGTGLGLSVSKGVVEAHGGTLSVESRPGQTCFTMDLPCGRLESAAASVA